jgi:hypothetical protein
VIIIIFVTSFKENYLRLICCHLLPSVLSASFSIRMVGLGGTVLTSRPVGYGCQEVIHYSVLLVLPLEPSLANATNEILEEITGSR